jgi:uncharacterized membrane protein YbaN (DUF454 family)
MVNNWQKYRGLSRRAKKVAILTIIPTFAISIFLAFSLIGDLIFGSFGFALCVWLAKRPEPPLGTSN